MRGSLDHVLWGLPQLKILASVDATKRLFERIGASDKELVIYPGFYHELFNEPEKQQIFDRVTEWMDKRNG